MKTYLRPLSILTSLVILINACSTTNKVQLDRASDINNAKESSTQCFIQKKDGSFENYASLKLITGVLKTPYLLADGKVKITANEIIAYQNKDHYAITQDKFENGHKSKVAVEALQGFAIRIAKGKLNVYSKKYYNGKNTVDELFVQNGPGGKIVVYNEDTMGDLLKDNPEALNFFNTSKHINPLSKKLQAVADLYNRGSLMTKN